MYLNLTLSPDSIAMTESQLKYEVNSDVERGVDQIISDIIRASSASQSQRQLMSASQMAPYSLQGSGLKECTIMEIGAIWDT